jgi:hypothetical protein
MYDEMNVSADKCADLERTTPTVAYPCRDVCPLASQNALPKASSDFVGVERGTVECSCVLFYTHCHARQDPLVLFSRFLGPFSFNLYFLSLEKDAAPGG